MKRVNFNMSPECHSLLKSACAIRNISLGKYVTELIAIDFEKLAYSDPRIREMFLAGDYPPTSKAGILKKRVLKSFTASLGITEDSFE